MESSKSTFHLRLFDLVVRAIAVLKALVDESICSWTILCYFFVVFLKLWQLAIDARKKTTGLSFIVFLFCVGRIASSCNSYVQVVLLDQYKMPSGIFPRKKRKRKKK